MTDNPTKSPRCDNAQSRLRARVFLARYAHLSLSETEGMTDDDLQTACENIAGFLQAELYRQKVPAPIRIEPPVIRRADPEGLLEALSQPLDERPLPDRASVDALITSAKHGLQVRLFDRATGEGFTLIREQEIVTLRCKAAERDLLLAEIEAGDVAVALDRLRTTAATLKTLDGLLEAFDEPEKCDSTEPKIVRRARGAVEMKDKGLELAAQVDRLNGLRQGAEDAYSKVSRVIDTLTAILSGKNPPVVGNETALELAAREHASDREGRRAAERVLIEAAVPAVTSVEPYIVRLARGAVQAIKDSGRLDLSRLRTALAEIPTLTPQQILDAAAATLVEQRGRVAELRARNDNAMSALCGVVLAMGEGIGGEDTPDKLADKAIKMWRKLQDRQAKAARERDDLAVKLEGAEAAATEARHYVTRIREALDLPAGADVFDCVRKAGNIRKRRELKAELDAVRVQLDTCARAADVPWHELAGWIVTAKAQAAMLPKLEAEIDKLVAAERAAVAKAAAWRGAMHRVAALYGVEHPSEVAHECEDQLKVAIRADGTWLTDRTCDGP